MTVHTFLRKSLIAKVPVKKQILPCLKSCLFFRDFENVYVFLTIMYLKAISKNILCQVEICAYISVQREILLGL